MFGKAFKSNRKKLTTVSDDTTKADGLCHVFEFIHIISAKAVEALATIALKNSRKSSELGVQNVVQLGSLEVFFNYYPRCDDFSSNC